MMRRIVLGPAWVGLVLAFGNVSAEPPWNVDDPGVTEKGALTVYDAVQVAWGPDGRSASWPSLAVTYGASDRFEIGLGFSALTSSGPALVRSIEWADFGVSGKYLVSGSPDDPLFAVAAQATFPLGTDSSSPPSQSVWLAGHAPFGRNRLTWNVGGTFPNRNRLASAFTGVVVDGKPDSKTVVGLELSGATPETRGDRHDLAWAVGFRRDLGRTFNLQARAGNSLLRPSEWTVFVGVTFEVPLGTGRSTP